MSLFLITLVICRKCKFRKNLIYEVVSMNFGCDEDTLFLPLVARVAISK